MKFPQISVGSWKFNWKSTIRGNEGVAQVEYEAGKTLEVRWRRDPAGIWLELPHGVFGFDMSAEKDDEGQILYSASERLATGQWSGVMPSRGEAGNSSGEKKQKVKATKIKAQMPGKIIRVLAQPGQAVEKDQPLILMEAMKMENEIRASQAGKVSQIKVTEGQAVETGADLIWIDPV